MDIFRHKDIDSTITSLSKSLNEVCGDLPKSMLIKPELIHPPEDIPSNGRRICALLNNDEFVTAMYHGDRWRFKGDDLYKIVRWFDISSTLIGSLRNANVTMD